MNDTVDMAAEVTRYLDKLGTTAEEIRTSLVDLGMTGQVGSRVTCPLARYLRTTLSDWHIMVGNFEVDWGGDDHRVLLSPAQKAFVSNFDTGRYPELKVSLTEAQKRVVANIVGDHAQ